MISLESEKFPNDLPYGHVQPLSYHNTYNSFSTLCQYLSQFFFAISSLFFLFYNFSNLFQLPFYAHFFFFFNLSDASSVKNQLISYRLTIFLIFLFVFHIFRPPHSDTVSIFFSHTSFFSSTSHLSVSHGFIARSAIIWDHLALYLHRFFDFPKPTFFSSVFLCFSLPSLNFSSFDNWFTTWFVNRGQSVSSSSSHDPLDLSFRIFLFLFSSPSLSLCRRFINLFITWFVGRGQLARTKKPVCTRVPWRTGTRIALRIAN